jgi:hypothetical protein
MQMVEQIPGNEYKQHGAVIKKNNEKFPLDKAVIPVQGDARMQTYYK